MTRRIKKIVMYLELAWAEWRYLDRSHAATMCGSGYQHYLESNQKHQQRKAAIRKKYSL